MTPPRPPSCILAHTRDPERPRPTLPNALICQGHYNHIEKMIAEAPALDRDLIAAHTAAAGNTYSERVSSSKTPGLNIRTDAIDARTALRRNLSQWADNTARARGFTRPGDAPIERIAVFLVRSLPWIVANSHPDNLTYRFNELNDATRHGRRIVQPAQRPHTIAVSPCVEGISCHVDDHTLDPCPGQLHVVFEPVDDLPAGVASTPPEIWCDTCGIRYEAARWYNLSKRVLTAAGRR